MIGPYRLTADDPTVTDVACRFVDLEQPGDTFTDLDVLPNARIGCHVVAYPPGVRVLLPGDAEIGDEPSLIMRTADNEAFTTPCTAHREFGDVWLVCFELPLGDYVVPAQSFGGSRQRQLHCEPGMDAFADPTIPNTVSLTDDPVAHGSNVLAWTCVVGDIVP